MYRYSLRINIIPNYYENERFDNLLDFCEKSKITDVMFFICAEEYNVGIITVAQAKPYVDMIKRHKLQLEDKGITISLNPWTTLAHGDRVEKDSSVNKYGAMVDCFGAKTQTTACPLDKEWLKDFIDLFTYLAKELSPNVLWMEDDFRLSNHEPLYYGGCFCKKHLALYSEFLGKENTLSEFINGLLSNDKIEYRKAFLAVNGKILNDVTREIGKAIEPYKNVRLGMMTSGACSYMVEGRNQIDVFSNLSLGLPAFNRVHLPSYRQETPQKYGFNFNIYSLLESYLTPYQNSILPELENFPSSLYCKSANFTRYQIESSIVLGAKGITLNIFEFNGNGVINNWGYDKILKKIKPFLDCIETLNLNVKKLSGVNVMIDYNAPIYKKLLKKDIAQLESHNEWWAGYLEQIGISVCFSMDKKIKDSVIAVANQYFRGLTNSEIIWLFGNNFVIVDGESVEILIEKGLGYLVNIEKSEVLSERKGHYSYEKNETKIKFLDINGACASSQYFCGDFHKFSYNKKTDKQINVFSCSYAPNGSKAGDSIVTVDNTLVMPFSNEDYAVGLEAPLRVEIIKYILTKVFLSTNIVTTCSAGLSPYYFIQENGNFLILVNTFDDDIEKIEFYLDRNIINIDFISSQDNCFRKVDFFNNHNNYTINIKINSLSAVALKLYLS